MLLAAASLAGCGDREDDVARGIGLSSDETAWVARWSAWSEDLGAAVAEEAQARVAVPEVAGPYLGSARWLRRCRAHFDDDVGAGPTARTDALAARIRGVCSAFERVIERVAAEARPGGDPVAAIVDAADQTGRAGDELVEIGETLERFSLARRALPVAGWPTDGSRRDRVLEVAAERDIEGFDTEVRCWSAREWPGMIEEEKALSNGGITIDSTGAFANTTTLQINMQQADCDVLGRAHAEGWWWPSSYDDRLHLAWALAVLAHEAQHIAGALDEAETECRGEQRVADVAIRLGAPVARARELALLSWDEQYPDLDPDYVTELCVDGGPYDLRPGTSNHWPWG
jgi:hypothetical protein